MKKILLLLFVLFMHPLAAQESPTFGGYLPCYKKCLDLEASALYWKTCRDDRLYAVSLDSDGSPLILSIVEPEMTWGWKVKGSISSHPCLFFDAEFTYFKDNNRNTTDNPTDTTFFADPVTSISLQVKNNYQRARVRAGFYLWQGGLGGIYTFGGFNWIYLWEQDVLNSPAVGGVELNLSQKSCFRGAGFDGGVGGSLTLFNCLGLRVECNGISAIGYQDYQFFLRSNNEGIASPVNKEYPKETICIPGLDIRFEANYRFSGPLPLMLAVGYEHHQFFNALRLTPLYSVVAIEQAVLQSEILDLGFAGLYATLRVNF